MSRRSTRWSRTAWRTAFATRNSCASPDLSAGLYVLDAGAIDEQSPHTEDEVYYVVRGQAQVTVGDLVRDVHPGSLVFVAANVPHRFHDITERLELLVAFGPAEGDRG